MEKNIDKLIKKEGFEKGLLLGVIMLALGIFTFYFITEMTDSMWMIVFTPVITSIILPLVIAVFFTLNLRKAIGGYWDLRKAVTGIFIMFVTSYALSSIGRDIIFAKLVEPQMTDKMAKAIVNATTAMKSGAEQSQIDEKITEIEKKFDEQKSPTIGNIIQGIVISIIMVFVLALLFAAIFKKEPPRNSLDTAIDPALQ
ncbi:DUF4199 domain-containing protein [Mucilaginibacter antarcticus]|uniref:DUF4199 domain-containing protein n=1 Tax=Mucilaginibacter antarcticus TaxID=1855725 RepID=A0ABW5XQ26_9SPHI